MKKPQKLKKTKIKLVTTLVDSQIHSLDKFVSVYEDDKNVNWKKTSEWRVTSEGTRGFIIVRYLKFHDGTNTRERFDRNIYSEFKKDEERCQEICRVLNYRHRSKLDALEAWKIKSTFIKDKNNDLHERFENFLIERSGNERHAKRCRAMVQQHFLDYFYYEREPALHDYLQWTTLKVQSEYLEYLFKKKVKSTRFINQNVPLAVKTIKSILQYVNLFFRFLHQESEGQIPLLKMTFPNATNARFQNHNLNRNKIVNKKTPSKEYIDSQTYKKIYASAPESIKSAIWLSYHFGLRRSEVLAIKPENLRKSHLKVIEQVVGVDTVRDEKKRGISSKARTGPLKSRQEEGRKVPYWYTKPEQAIKHIEKLKLMHPSGLSGEWIELMKKLKMDFTFHNLRNAFCSNALRDMKKFDISPVSIQLALGHIDIRTTISYLRDYRELDDEKWTPVAG